MKEAGYIYVLMNPSLQGMVKIGKTTRDVEDRAKELSAATGVPTPFTVVYDAYFSDCDAAEKYAHTLLSEKGYRVSEHREFFEIPIKDAIDAVMLTREHFGDINQSDIINDNEPAGSDIFSEDDDFFSELNYNEKKINPATEMMELGDKYYYGHDDEFVDYDEAYSYYQKALKLGSVEAYRKIGTMLANGEGVTQNKKYAFKYFKEGAKKHDYSCYAEIAKVFDDNENVDDAIKAWNKYFDSIEEANEINASAYIDFLVRRKIPIMHKVKLVHHADFILKSINTVYEDLLSDDEYTDAAEWYLDENTKYIEKYLLS